ncbi:MAG: pyridoxal phosphate-dependent aminotransferase, partial [Dorea sp.]
MEKKPEFHGSDLEKIEEYYHIPKEEIVCFSANVNPLGLSESVKKTLSANLDIISTYPDRNYTSLKKAISNYTGVSSEHIVVGNGSTELISLLISQRAPKKALVLGPTYSEYARELSLVGGIMEFYNLKESMDFKLDIEDFLTQITDDTELVIICNPNNPTSSALHQCEMELIISYCKEHSVFVMIDETYVEFAPDMEAITSVPLAAKYNNFMVIRGVSKFYAAPGLRFGYGITSNESFLSSLLKHQNPWSLNTIGAYAGELMFKDDAYIKQTKELICSERDRILTALSDNPSFKVYPAYGNFILVKLLKDGLTSFDVFETAIRQKMMIRDCSS